jgi:hypothetical protein
MKFVGGAGLQSRMAITAAAALLCAGPAAAGPPFLNDDPIPTERGHWEIYGYAAGVNTPGNTPGAGGLDLNYGAARDLQLTAVLPFAYENGDAGPGNVELAAKYQILHQDKDALGLAVFPRVFLPTGGRRYSTGHVSLLLPVWAQRDFGPWSVFGGGGYTLNPGGDQRNFWIAGLGASRTMSKSLSLGVEVFHQTRDAADARDSTVLNVGATWRLNDHWSLLASGGPGLQNARQEGRYIFYMSLKADY